MRSNGIRQHNCLLNNCSVIRPYQLIRISDEDFNEIRRNLKQSPSNQLACGHLAGGQRATGDICFSSLEVVLLSCDERKASIDETASIGPSDLHTYVIPLSEKS